jgi:capsular polysaccharide biosynthesis protein
VEERYALQDAATKNSITRYFSNKATLEFNYSKGIYLKAALDQITDKMTSVPQYQANLNRLDQEIQSTTDLRNQFKNQQEGSNISQALFQDISSSKYRVVEPAKIGIDPVEPNRMKILLMGLALGLVIGAAATVLVELLDTSFKKVADVEEHLGLEVLGIAPRIDYMSKVVN